MVPRHGFAEDIDVHAERISNSVNPSVTSWNPGIRRAALLMVVVERLLGDGWVRLNRINLRSWRELNAVSGMFRGK
ncbi:hypothetical protein RRG08_044607 [Elysia crispata]|uniref:Uncharacterized protein n=1 Tax=Elysia crispata TaxID=231223 RepID=A0AAE0YM99_9GAST|nr:hypothetical protein RRG08_044607 [Elysia crispata]